MVRPYDILLTWCSFRTRFGPHTSRHNSVTQAGIRYSGVPESGFRNDSMTGTTSTSASLAESATASSHPYDGPPIPKDNSAKKKRARPNPLPPRAWTDAEDADLVKGYQKYGFQWSLIARDPNLTFLNRTGAHVRDRFRLKFPDIYRDVSKTHRDALAEVKARRGKEAEKPATNRNDGLAEVVETGHGHDDNDDYEGIQGHAFSHSMTKQSLSATTPFNITGLLNDDEDDNRLSSFRYDDWDENVTLPPLLWEDMATRPMFDLE